MLKKWKVGIFRELAVDLGKEGLNLYHGVLGTPAEICNNNKKISWLSLSTGLLPVHGELGYLNFEIHVLGAARLTYFLGDTADNLYEHIIFLSS